MLTSQSDMELFQWIPKLKVVTSKQTPIKKEISHIETSGRKHLGTKGQLFSLKYFQYRLPRVLTNSGVSIFLCLYSTFCFLWTRDSARYNNYPTNSHYSVIQCIWTEINLRYTYLVCLVIKTRCRVWSAIKHQNYQFIMINRERLSWQQYCQVINHN